MRTYAGTGLVILAEVAALGLARTRWRPSLGRNRREDDARTLTATLEIEDAGVPLPAGPLTLPRRMLTELAADPMLGLTRVRVLRQVRQTGPTPIVGPALAPTSTIPGTGTTGPNLLPLSAVPAIGLTWLELRLALPGSRDLRATRRAAGPIMARGGGQVGAESTLDKAARTAASRLATAGFTATRLTGPETRTGLTVGAVATFEGGALSGESTTRQRPGFTGFRTRRPTDVFAERFTRLFADLPGDLLTDRAASFGAGWTAEPTPATDPLRITPSGLAVGHDPAGQPVVLTLFRRSPLTLTVLGGLPLVQLLALRASTVGARILVETGRPAAWNPIRHTLGHDPDRFRMQPVGRPLAQDRPADPATPLLVIRDSGARPPYADLPRGPWTAVLTFLPFLDPRAAGQLSGADLVGCQRITPREASIAGQVLDLAERETVTLAGLPDHSLWWRAGCVRQSRIVMEPWESALVGALSPVPAAPRTGGLTVAPPR